MSRFGSRAAMAAISSLERPNSAPRASRSLTRLARSTGSRRTWDIISFVGKVLSHLSTLPIGVPLQDFRIELQEQDDAPLGPEVPHVVGDVGGELHDRASADLDLFL